MWRGSEHRDFLRLRFLDLHDHVGGLEHRRRVRKDRRAGLLIGAVGAIDAVAGLGLDEQLMAVRRPAPRPMPASGRPDIHGP